MQIKNDIAYIPNNDQAVLDLYQPSKPKPAGGYPGMVVIHGGGWQNGDKSQLRQTQMAETMCENGYVCINVNYSLASDKNNKGPYIRQAFLECRHAVHWFRQQANELQLNTKRIGAIGGSAGANMSLMLGFSHQSPDFALPGIQDSSVQAVVNLYAPVTRPPELCVIDYIHSNGPPVLTVHGTDDQVVNVQHAYDLDKALRPAGVEHEIIIVDGAPHTFNLSSEWGDYRDIAKAFFDKHLKV